MFVIRLSTLIWPLLCLCCYTQAIAADAIFFTPNRGQWDSRIQYQLEIPGGYMYLEQNCQTFYFLDRPSHHPKPIEEPAFIKAHAFKARFVGANTPVNFKEEEKTAFYSNYYLGNDQSKWKTGIHSYKKITYSQIYPGIDYIIGENAGTLKSDYLVRKGYSPGQIKIQYEGLDKIALSKGKLVMHTSLAQLVENAPYAYQVIDGIKKPVDCQYVLTGNTVTFDVGIYNPAYDLVIDPVLTFSTFIGSTADNFGCTATYDLQKNVFGGALVYRSGVYPTTLGALQPSFAGSNLSTRDMGISKFDATGVSLLYSTYLGGATGTEVPHSLVADRNGNLFVFGSSGSTDYPVTTGAFDQTFNGGVATSATNQGLQYNNGVDIVVSKFNAAGTVLMGSTYLGGTGNDGVNITNALKYNYGDFIRGEIILDNLGNPIICSTTNSSDYPVTSGAAQTAFGGLTDAVITKLNMNLTGLIWSTYFGGSQHEGGYGMQPDAAGNLFFTGGTNSSDLPVTPGAYQATDSGGTDGYLAKINAAGNTILAATYVGTSQYDQSYLIQTDPSNDVYIFGQSNGDYPQTAGKYNNGNSGQFIHKFNNTLTTSVFSTRIGRGTGEIDISPTAFLVNNCYKIFICGWGGETNSAYSQASSSSTSGLPTTADGYQQLTDGSDFYLAIYSPDMGGLEYGTFLGGNVSHEHVDGGTARFDKDGYVYQAVCAGCGGHDDFPTTPGAWSNTNDSPNCNLGVFKFNLETVIAHTTISTLSPMCTVPYGFEFTNTSTFTNSFSWDFGDGTTDTVSNPTHYYPAPGDYVVTLIAIDTSTCGNNDTLTHNIHVPEPITLTTYPGATLCLGDSIPVNITIANPGVTYSWTPSLGVSDPASGNVTITPDTTTEYTGIGVNLDGCSDTVRFTLNVIEPIEADFTTEFTPCVIPLEMVLNNTSTGGVNYTWQLDGITVSATDLLHTFNAPGTYVITLICDDNGVCGFTDTVSTTVFLPPPAVAVASGTDTVCVGTPIPLSASGGATYTWFPAGDLNNPNLQNPMLTATGPGEYFVVVTDTNNCTDTASVPIFTFPVQTIDAGSDLVYDMGEGPLFHPVLPDGGTVLWSPAMGLSCTTCLNPEATPEETTTYYLTYTDVNGCIYVDSMMVMVTPSVFIPNAFTPNGDGMNDFFAPIVRNLDNFEITIFTRWGELIYTSNEKTGFWDGTHKQIKCKSDVYVWKIKYASQLEPSKTLEKTGHVTLLR